MSKPRKIPKQVSTLYSFSAEEQWQLKQLQQLIMLYDYQIKSFISMSAAKNGIDVVKNKINYNLSDMTYSVVEQPEPTAETPPVDKK